MTTGALILKERSSLSQQPIWRLPHLGARGIWPGHAFIAVTGSELIEHLREMRLARGLALGALNPADVVVALIRRPTSRSSIFSGKNVSKRGPTEAVFGTFLPKYASERSGAVRCAGSVPPWQRAAPVVRPTGCAPPWQRSAPVVRRPTTPHPATRRATPRFPSAPTSRPRAAPQRYDSQPTPHGRTPARFPSTGRPAHGRRSQR